MSNKIKFEPALKEQIIRLHLEEGRTIKSLTEEFHLGKGTLRYWLTQRSKECQTNENIQQENDSYAEINRLRKELAEIKKENEFLKKAAAFFAKEIDQRNTSLFKNTLQNSVSDGFSEGLISVQMLITIT